MSDYLLCVVGAVFIGAIINAILPDGKTAGMVKSSVKLLCLLVILTPIVRGISTKEFMIENYFSQSVIKIDDNFIEYCSEKTISTAQTQLQKELFEKFAVNAVVRLELDEGADGTTQGVLKIDCIYVSAVEFKNEIQEYLAMQYGCKVVIEE